MNYTKLVHFNVRRKKVNRSLAGNILMLLFLLLCAIFSVLPMIYSVVTAFKPFDELWRYPPSLVWVDNPTTVKRVVDKFENNGKTDRFSAPEGVFVAGDNTLFVADSQ